MAEKTGFVTKERLAKGYTYAQYLEAVKVNRELFEDSYSNNPLSEDDERFFADLNKRAGPIKAIAIAEDWCPDVSTNLPIFQRIAEAAGNIELRIFPRDENLDIMNEYLTNDCMSIPTVVFFDENLCELGRWVERPAAATKMMTEVRGELNKRGLSQQEFRSEYRKAISDELRAAWRTETVREIRGIFAR